MGSRYRLTTSWAILSATVGIPNGPVSVLLSPFGLSTLRTGGGKWLPEASRLRARPCSVFGRPVHLSGLLPLISDPVVLLKPFGPRLAADALPSEDSPMAAPGQPIRVPAFAVVPH